MMSLFTKHKKVVVREEGAARRDWPFTLKYYLDMTWILKFLSPFRQMVRHKRQKVQFSYRVVVNSGQRGDDWGAHGFGQTRRNEEIQLRRLCYTLLYDNLLLYGVSEREKHTKSLF